MKFKKWLFTEMPHMSIVGEPDLAPGKKHIIDMRFELWPDGVARSYNDLPANNVMIKDDPKDPLGKAEKKDFVWHLPFVAPYKDGWLVAKDPIKSGILHFMKEKPKGEYQEVPERWIDYAQEFVLDEED